MKLTSAIFSPFKTLRELRVKLKDIKPRVPVKSSFFILAFCVCLDVFQVILDLIAVGEILNPPIDFVMYLVVWLGFNLKYHISIKGSSKRYLAMLFTAATKAALGFLDLSMPLWTVDVGIYIGTSWAEDIEKQALPDIGKITNAVKNKDKNKKIIPPVDGIIGEPGDHNPPENQATEGNVNSGRTPIPYNRKKTGEENSDLMKSPQSSERYFRGDGTSPNDTEDGINVPEIGSRAPQPPDGFSLRNRKGEQNAENSDRISPDDNRPTPEGFSLRNEKGPAPIPVGLNGQNSGRNELANEANRQSAESRRAA